MVPLDRIRYMGCGGRHCHEELKDKVSDKKKKRKEKNIALRAPPSHILPFPCLKLQ
jgi:hypothetical protein